MVAIPKGYTPLYDKDGEVIGGYGQIVGPIEVESPLADASEDKQRDFANSLRRSLGDLCDPTHPVLFRRE